MVLMPGFWEFRKFGPKGLFMVLLSRNARPLRPLQGPDVRLPKIVTLRPGDATVRAVIGPLNT